MYDIWMKYASNNLIRQIRFSLSCLPFGHLKSVSKCSLAENQLLIYVFECYKIVSPM